MRKMLLQNSVILPCLLALLGIGLDDAVAAEPPALRAMLDNETGLSGGVIIHLGCGDGRGTAELAGDGRFVVHGLDVSSENVARARAHIEARGLYGPVSVARLRKAVLPYADGMVNVVLAQELGDVPMGEVMRVLAPQGIALVKVDGRWQRSVKPRPAEIGDWTHYLNGPDNNAVAEDTVIAPPRRLRWQCGPKWTRHHDKMSSFSGMVSTEGRVFYILDEGSTASIYMPSHWALIARDAFNGKLLWRRSMENWFSRYKGLKDGPADAPRRLVASGGRVYATLSLKGPVTSLDAIDGETIRVYDGTEGAEEILLSDGTLFVLIGSGSIDDGRRSNRPTEQRTIVALDAETGRKLWQHSDVVAALTPAVDKRRLYYFNFDSQQVVGLDRATGKKLWASKDKLPTPQAQRSFFASKLVVSDGVVLLAGGEVSGMIKSGAGASKADTLTALAADDGRTLWTGDHLPSGYSSPEDLFVIDGLVWSGANSNGKQDGMQVAYDLKTGEVKHRFPSDQQNYWFHHRCYSGRATSNYILTSRTGLEFVDFRAKKWDLNHWVRGACLYGIMPANGLIYSPPAPCICYAETMLHSFNALAPAATTPLPVVDDVERLEKGPVFDEKVEGGGSSLDWPTYRGANSRLGATDAALPHDLSTAWQLDLAGPLSGVTVADGKVFVAAIDRHTVYAVSADRGEVAWEYTAGGRVDSPPTYFDGRVLFGSADGYVYCLRATDGALIWRFLAARCDRRILAYEQIESCWPVHGSVLVCDGVAHFVSGRSVFVDGGMCLWRIDARSGEIVSKTVLDERNPRTGENVQDTIKWLNMAVGRPDILSTDGERLYMRSQAFDLEGTRLAMGPEIDSADEGTRQGGETTHLFCPTGFLDSSWFHRTYWLYAQTWSSGWCGYHVAGKFAPAGKIMSVDDEHVFVFGREPQYFKWTTPMEYRLFAAKKIWQPAPAAAKVPDEAAKNRRRAATKPLSVNNPANYAWSTKVPILVRAMLLAGDKLFLAGPRDLLDEEALGRSFLIDRTDAILDQETALAGKSGAVLAVVSAEDGATLAEYDLDSPPVFDGMAAARGRLFLTTIGGRLMCLGPKIEN